MRQDTTLPLDTHVNASVYQDLSRVSVNKLCISLWHREHGGPITSAVCFSRVLCFN